MIRPILLTGAAGKIGSFFHNAYVADYDFTLTDIAEPTDTHGAPFVRADLSDYDAIRPLFDGIDSVVHLGADPSMEAAWESLLPNNVIATHNVFEAAHQAGCRRVVYASSINAVLGYPRDQQVHTSQPVFPINLYGATKCWGEALARYHAAAHGFSCLCLRFGAVQYRDSEMIHLDHQYIDIIQTLDDNARLIAAAVNADDDIMFGNFHGLSNNRYKRLDMIDTNAILNYAPQDDAFEIARKNSSS